MPPAWIGMVRGAIHNESMDTPTHNAIAASVLAFAQYVTSHDATAAAVFTGPDYGLGRDAAYTRVDRNALAEAAS